MNLYCTSTYLYHPTDPVVKLSCSEVLPNADDDDLLAPNWSRVSLSCFLGSDRDMDWLLLSEAMRAGAYGLVCVRVQPLRERTAVRGRV